jgi:hypothetical protein
MNCGQSGFHNYSAKSGLSGYDNKAVGACLQYASRKRTFRSVEF